MIHLYAVLTREYLRRLCFFWSMLVLVLIGLPWTIMGVAWLKGQYISFDTASASRNFIMYQQLALGFLPLLTLLIQWQIYPHLYARPISTRAMAGWLMATGAVTVAGTNVLILLSYRFLFGAEWPLFAPRCSSSLSC